MIVMSLASGGLYQLYWSYRNWRYIKETDSSRIMPFWRAWFVLFFHYSLVKRVKDDTEVLVPVNYNPAALTVLYFLLLLVWRLPDPWAYISFFDFLPLLPVVSAINSANEGRVPVEAMNRRFTWQNLTLVSLAVTAVVISALLRFRPDLLPS